MTDHFDKWINGMTENQYEDWLEDEATNAQEEKALNIRTPLSEQEEEDIEREQEFKVKEQELEQREQAIEEKEKQIEITIKELKEIKELPIEKLRPILAEIKKPVLLPPIKIKGLPIPKLKPALPIRLPLPLPLPTPRIPVLPLSSSAPLAVIPKAISPLVRPALPLPRPSIPTVALKAPVTGIRAVTRTAVTAIRTGFSILRRVIRI